jgi:hypothetical protein
MLENIAIITELFKDYDGFSLLAIIVFYLLVDKRIKIVDKAVNHRPFGQLTISEEVTEINHKIDMFGKDLAHVKKEIDEHRAVDEVAFRRIEKDIRVIASKV